MKNNTQTTTLWSNWNSTFSQFFLIFSFFFSNIWHKQFVLWSWCDNKTINQVMLSPLNNTMVFPLFSQVVSWPSYTSWCRNHFLSGDLCFRCDSDYTFICKYSNDTSGPCQVQRQFFYLRLNCALHGAAILSALGYCVPVFITGGLEHDTKM